MLPKELEDDLTKFKYYVPTDGSIDGSKKTNLKQLHDLEKVVIKRNPRLSAMIQNVVTTEGVGKIHWRIVELKKIIKRAAIEHGFGDACSLGYGDEESKRSMSLVDPTLLPGEDKCYRPINKLPNHKKLPTNHDTTVEGMDSFQCNVCVYDILVGKRRPKQLDGRRLSNCIVEDNKAVGFQSGKCQGC